jgi:hypothetical protein
MKRTGDRQKLSVTRVDTKVELANAQQLLKPSFSMKYVLDFGYRTVAIATQAGREPIQIYFIVLCA